MTGKTDLEYMEGLKLDVLALISQQVHHHLKIGFASNISRHDVEVCAIKQNLAQELQGLAFRDIII